MLSKNDHLAYLQQALELSRNSPLKQTNFRVGALLVSNPTGEDSTPAVLATGYTLELPGNTHAEQCALAKLADQHKIPESQLNSILTPDLNTTLYSTLEPCGQRLSENIPCVRRIISTRSDPSGRSDSEDSKWGIQKVIFGAMEPSTFVEKSESRRMMDEAGLAWEYVEGLQDHILEIAKEGHTSIKQETKIDDIDEEERRRQAQIPRNSKKRMMEVPPP